MPGEIAACLEGYQILGRACPQPTFPYGEHPHRNLLPFIKEVPAVVPKLASSLAASHRDKKGPDHLRLYAGIL